MWKKVVRCQKETRRMRIWRLQSVRGGCVLPAATWTRSSGVAHFTFPLRAHKAWRTRRAQGQKAPFEKGNEQKCSCEVLAGVFTQTRVVPMGWLRSGQQNVPHSVEVIKSFLLCSALQWLPEILRTGLGVEFLLSRSSTLIFFPLPLPSSPVFFAEAHPF